MALLTFSHVVALREALTADAPRVRAALAAIAPGGSTSLVDAASAALLAAEPGPSRTLIIVFSDGQDTSSWLVPDRVVESARSSDSTVYAVTVRESRRPEFLRALADVTGGAVIEIDSTQDLSATFTRILDEFRRRYVLSYSPQGVSREGWHRLDVRVRGRRADVRARPGYVAGP